MSLKRRQRLALIRETAPSGQERQAFVNQQLDLKRSYG